MAGSADTGVVRVDTDWPEFAYQWPHVAVVDCIHHRSNQTLSAEFAKYALADWPSLASMSDAFAHDDRSGLVCQVQSVLE